MYCIRQCALALALLFGWLPLGLALAHCLVGARLYLDDILPATFGQPLLGGTSTAPRRPSF